jgi:ABC-type transport system substrate-binding protein
VRQPDKPPARSARRHPMVLLAAVGASLSVLAVACGGGDDGGGGAATGATSPAPTDAGTTPVSVGGSEAPNTAPGTTEAPAETPVPGGKVIMGVEADAGSPWMPAEMQCDISCHQMIRTVYDPLVLPVEGNTWAPYLAESLTPNADSTQWTIKVRPGITFHDGTPLDGAAVVDNMLRYQKGFLTGAYLSNMASAAVDPNDPMAAVLTMKTPWAAFPTVLAISQLAYIASPTWMKAADDAAAAGDNSLKTKAVGTGPFVLQDYKPNEFFKAKKNPNYWNKPYPYLDEIEFRPIADALQRADALKTGAIDMMHSDHGDVIAEFRDNKDFVQDEITNNAEVAYELINVTETLPDGTQSPLIDQRLRCGLANAIDEQTILTTIDAGVSPLANGPFDPTMVGYLEDTGYPQKQDMDKAKSLIAAYRAEHPGPLNLSLGTTTDATNLTIAQFRKQWWEEAGVDSVTINQVDQASYITTALLGKFQVFGWRLHSGIDLDDQYIWWHSSSAAPVGDIALNFSRIKDPVIDQALDANRAETDPAKKKEYAETVNKRFAEQCYNLWESWTVWGVPHKPTVHGVENFTLPGGEKTIFGAGIGGTFYDQTLWVSQ